MTGHRASAGLPYQDLRLPRMLIHLRGLIALLAVLALQGCGALHRLDAVPVTQTMRAEVPGMPGVRYWVDRDVTPCINDNMDALQHDRDALAKQGQTGALPPANFLAISGGGDDGAFGAGLLTGWSKSGTRPVFKGVTGISTGALIAPFAFLGHEYDDRLSQVYTSVSKKDIAEERSLMAALTSDGMADNRPLWQLLGKYVDDAMLARIAEEYGKGRLLLIGTTNLDARRPVIWNMGAIAASKSPKALELFRSIMLASAAIPGAFPPVMIDVEVDGKKYQEMHVDGGTTAQVFLYPPRLSDVMDQRGMKMPPRERRAYIIRNARLDPEWASVERRTMSIAGRAIASLIQTQGLGDLYRIYLTAQKDGLDYNLAFIGADFKAEHREDFDPAYMKALYDYGYRLALKGYPWKKAPPGLAGSELPGQIH